MGGPNQLDRPISHRGQRNLCEARGNKAPGEEPCAGCQKMLPEPPIGAPNQPASKPRPEDAAETKMWWFLRWRREEGLPRRNGAAASGRPDGRRKRSGRKQSTRVTRGGRGPESEHQDQYQLNGRNQGIRTGLPGDPIGVYVRRRRWCQPWR